MPRPVKRPYDNSGREAAARETRRAVVTAARELFLQKGFAASTLSAIATRAGVSVQTVYGQFGSKQALLRQVVDEAIVGDDLPVAVIDRPEVAAQLGEPDPRVRLRMHAEWVSARMPQLESVDRVLRSAADADADVRREVERNRTDLLEGMTQMCQFYASRDELAVPVPEAAQRIAALIGPELYRRTVLENGWSQEEYADWLADLMAASVLKAVRRRR